MKSDNKVISLLIANLFIVYNIWGSFRNNPHIFIKFSCALNPHHHILDIRKTSHIFVPSLFDAPNYVHVNMFLEYK